MLTQELIRKKRDRNPLSPEEINFYIKGVTGKSVSEAQVAAMSMAILLNGMSMGERVALTSAMASSGTMLDWTKENLNGPVLDKHSTGGVGDKVSLMLAPIVAACGGFVPMISGRGLGHTGGTLDKMDSIPGYVSQPDLPLFRKAVREAGCAIVGQTADLAPADKIIYAVRDVTGTVESLDLITASILSKKLAAGLQGLVMDVKFGSGAWWPDYDRAKELAQSIVSVANGAGLKTSALMTDMNQVLGRTAGNAIEVRESVEFLRGEQIEPRLYDVTLALCAELLVLGNISGNADEASALAEKNLKNGRAAEIFACMVHILGGPEDIIEAYENHLPLAPQKRDVFPRSPGYVVAIDVRKVGLAVIELGGGRRIASDRIDHGVGLSDVASPGEKTGPGERPLCTIFARDENSLHRAEAAILEAFTVSPENPGLKKSAPVREKITGR